MIQKLKLISLGLIGTIVISSCKTNFTITKRKVNKGYYISSNRMKTSSNDIAVNKEKEIDKEKTLVLPIERSKKELILKNEEFVQPVLLADNSTSKNAISSEETKIPAENKHKKASSKAKVPTYLEKFTTFKNIKQVAHVKAKKIAPASSSSEALSLLWIVILVLLILWALGFISGGWGMGGLINLLLVIALILLILWLLRII